MLSGGLYLSGLWPPFREVVTEYLQPWVEYFGLEGRIVSGFRSIEEQDALFHLGRTQAQYNARVRLQGRNGSVTDAPPGSSAHNYGLAIDVEGRNQSEIIQVGAALGFGTVSWDPAHLEWPNWQALLR
jgi:hypothetical protein